jgi:hypothetical protein
VLSCTKKCYYETSLAKYTTYKIEGHFMKYTYYVIVIISKT